MQPGALSRNSPSHKIISPLTAARHVFFFMRNHEANCSGSYHGKLSEFHEVHRQRRSKAVRSYLQGIPDLILRAAVSVPAGGI
jgi:hypothetical protein